VRDKAKREPFAPSDRIAEKIHREAMAQGVLTYPIQGCVDGARGDHILLAPPFILSEEESNIISRALSSALARVFAN